MYSLHLRVVYFWIEGDFKHFFLNTTQTRWSIKLLNSHSCPQPPLSVTLGMSYPTCPADVLSVFPYFTLSPVLCILQTIFTLWMYIHYEWFTFCPRVLNLFLLVWTFFLASQLLLLPLQLLPLTLVLAGLPAAWAIAGVRLRAAPVLIIHLNDFKLWLLRNCKVDSRVRKYQSIKGLYLGMVFYLSTFLSRFFQLFAFYTLHQGKKLACYFCVWKSVTKFWLYQFTFWTVLLLLLCRTSVLGVIGQHIFTHFTN